MMQAPNPKLQQAIQHHQGGQLEEAKKLYQELVSEGNVSANIYSNFAGLLNQLGEIEEALKLLESASVTFPNDTEVTMALCQTALNSGDFDRARQLANSILLRFPTSAEAHYVLGNIYLNENNIEQAHSSFEKAAESSPQFIEAHYCLGITHQRKGEIKEAEGKFKHVLTLYPTFLQAWLNLANLYIDSARYEEAITHLDQVLSFDPDHYSAIKMKGMVLHTTGEVDEALALYLKIHNEQSPSEEVLTLIANANRDLDRFRLAEQYYSQVLAINPNNTIAKENIENFQKKKIEGWHFSMLSDLKRNDGYDESIKRVVKKGDTVLDIGTGTGLLSMMCARAGASKIYTCETIEAIADVAKVIIADNNYQDEIEVFHAKSNQLKIGKEIPQKVDVLVSEILDVGLLGEGVLPSLRHATANLLKEGGKIIPAAADVIAVLVQSKYLGKASKIHKVSGFDLSSFGKFQVEESYMASNLLGIPHQLLSDEFSPLSIDFYHLPKISSIEEPNIHKIEVPIIEDGEIDALAFWFNLHLDQELTLSSGPGGEMVHWGQAIISLDEAKKVKKGETVTVIAKQYETKLRFSIEE